MKIEFDRNNPLIGGFLVAEYYKLSYPDLSALWSNINVATLTKSEKLPLETSNDVVRALLYTYGAKEEKEPLREAQVNQFLELALDVPNNLLKSLEDLDLALRPSTFLLGDLSAVDYAVFAAIWETISIEEVLKSQPRLKNLQRWLKTLLAGEFLKSALSALPEEVKTRRRKPVLQNGGGKDQDAADGVPAKTRLQEGKFIELPGAEPGKVIVRFPPEASGYLHIGHAKAALLNQYYQLAYQGQLIMRFDDTNPAKENVDFEKVILEDLKLLEIEPDRFTHTSEYFDLMLGMCERLIKEGKAFVDDTPAEQMKTEREQRLNSSNRDNSAEKNLSLWEEMKGATAVGIQCCVRAKIDMQSHNGCMRDPTIYRCKPEPHPRTGTKYKVYPTYDFACPIVDSVEDVTHVLRTTEYHDRDVQFFWFIDALGLRKPHIWEYSRLNMTNTVLSKRKLTWFVEQGLVDGWDDPRMPTVRGILRRGMTVEGLKQFIKSQGSSRSVVFMEWDKIWAINKKVIDAVAPRFTALQSDPSPVPVFLKNLKEAVSKKVALHPKNPAHGEKTILVSQKILIDEADAKLLKEGELTTFINYGNVNIDKISKSANGTITSVEATPHLDNEDYKKTLKLTWLTDPEKESSVETYCVYFDHIISKAVLGKDEDFKQYIGHETRKEVRMIGERGLGDLKVGDIIQLQRRGFFRVDVAAAKPSPISGKGRPCVLFHIPDGHTSERLSTNVPVKQPSPAAVDVKQSVDPAENEASLFTSIADQGNKVRVLKEQKSDKSVVDKEIQTLLALKKQFKETTGKEWKPNLVPQNIKQASPPTTESSNESDLLQKISSQGDKVRLLKEQKAEKSVIDAEIQSLLALKKQFKEATGKDWKPNLVPQTAKQTSPPTTESSNESDLLQKISSQGDKVRLLKEQKAEKSVIDAEIQSLLALKKQFKEATGKDWKPNLVPQTAKQTSPPTTESSNESDLLQKISSQGDKVRLLKEQKAEKSVIDAEIQSLLALKKQFKEATGKDWKPNLVPQTAKQTSPPTTESSNESDLLQKISSQGDKVRLLKEQKVEKSVIDAEIQSLLALKKQFKEATGKDWKPDSAPSRTPKDAAKPAKAKKEDKTAVTKPAEAKADKPAATTGPKKQTRLGLEAKKLENLPEWYSQVITKGELIEYYDVSGCYILRPWAYAIWDGIKSYLSEKIRADGVEDCYFPIFVSKAALEREKDHIADFAPEVAWVTHSGDTQLAEPIAIRPTSETVMYPSYAKWIQSHRDLPLRLNQWNNVVRWEFQHPQPFLRTREFLWQEGHTAYEDKESAEKEVKLILDFYTSVYVDLLAIPVVQGRKTEKERFAGGDYSLTVEAFVPASGRGIQGATSHHLGQNFSKMFEIVFNDPKTQEKKYVYQNSWGLTTRTIGVIIMVHGDDQGLVMPPRIAPIQVVIVPCGITVSTSQSDRNALLGSCESLERDLKAAGIRVRGDYRDNYSPGWKFNHWELKGVPIRIELGPKDMAADQLVAVRRATGQKLTIKRDTAVKDITELLETIHHDMLNRATAERDSRVSQVNEWKDLCAALDKQNIILAPACTQIPCEDKIKKDSARTEPTAEALDKQAPAMGAKALCIPLVQPRPIEATDRCINPGCSNTPVKFVLFGRSY